MNASSQKGWGLWSVSFGKTKEMGKGGYCEPCHKHGVGR